MVASNTCASYDDILSCRVRLALGKVGSDMVLFIREESGKEPIGVACDSCGQEADEAFAVVCDACERDACYSCIKAHEMHCPLCKSDLMVEQPMRLM